MNGPLIMKNKINKSLNITANTNTISDNDETFENLTLTLKHLHLKKNLLIHLNFQYAFYPADSKIILRIQNRSKTPNPEFFKAQDHSEEYHLTQMSDISTKLTQFIQKRSKTRYPQFYRIRDHLHLLHVNIQYSNFQHYSIQNCTSRRQQFFNFMLKINKIH